MKLIRFPKLLLALGVFAGAAPFASAQYQYLGEIRMVPYTFAPTGWAMCNGQILSIQQNTALFSLLGISFGGNGINSFALPNFEGRFPIHQGVGPGGTSYTLGQTGGATTYTLTVEQLPPHSHPLVAATVEAAAVSPNGNSLATKARVPLYTSAPPTVVMNDESVGLTGGGQPYNVTPPFLAVTFIIALEGIYPSRN
jgi:microcystin-dependent protein